MMRVGPVAFTVLATAGAASAQATLSIPLERGTSDSVLSQIYACGDGGAFSVQYVNAGANALAILPIDGEDRIFVNVVSASGARYVSGAYVWWTKGDTATLENELSEGSLQDCRSPEALP
ncbi:MliC family protein [Maliponia aquimaris]|uniref:Membrane-bound lysozyme inhibitor of C-type lysozyme n=1 Tax=Maliponia aquimaris TaxID=1673631 RepID=A0A238L1A5_9RHOB|nr:MliC family protein [Maliponia aquimaris]SMX48799.1 Membrane-bound lysozyme inhibitor of C-type lysozyme precursor [Maliponia aquimaris]